MPSNLDKIIEYYDSCEIDYKLIWNLNRSYAMHFGYWDEGVKTLPQALERTNEVLSKMANVKQSDVILDAGCGVGGSAIYLSKKYGARSVGITLSKRQVDSAKRNALKNGVANLTEFYDMDFSKTSFPDKSFDVVWAIESICHAEDKSKFINEAYRLLKDKGRLIIADGFMTSKDQSEESVGLLEKWLEGWSVDFLETKDDFQAKLSQTGFKNITYTNINKYVMPSSKRLYWYSLPAVFMSKAGELLRLRTKIQTDNVIAANLQYKTLKDGIWEYGIVYAEK